MLRTCFAMHWSSLIFQGWSIMYSRGHLRATMKFNVGFPWVCSRFYPWDQVAKTAETMQRLRVHRKRICPSSWPVFLSCYLRQVVGFFRCCSGCGLHTLPSGKLATEMMGSPWILSTNEMVDFHGFSISMWVYWRVHPSMDAFAPKTSQGQGS